VPASLLPTSSTRRAAADRIGLHVRAEARTIITGAEAAFTALALALRVACAPIRHAPA